VDNAETSDLILGNFEIGVVAKSPVPMPSGENKYSVCGKRGTAAECAGGIHRIGFFQFGILGGQKSFAWPVFWSASA
jgi:hypothetical protein